MENSKPRDVQIHPIAADTVTLRSRSWNRLRFEIEYALERGTTANSFIIRADKTALIDPPGESFTEIYLTALKQLAADAEKTQSNQAFPLWSQMWSKLRWITQQHIDLGELGFDLQKLDYVILGHVNPNRIATLKALLDIAPNITFVCSNPGAIVLREAMPEQDLQIQVIRSAGTETLDLGQGHQLKFIPAPTPRWPAGLITYDPKTQVLFTDKFYGAHVCGEAVFDEEWAPLQEDRRYYFDCLMAPHVRKVETILDKLEPLPVVLYAPDHGPLAHYSLTELTHAYRQWSKQQKAQELKVSLIYASAYGNTATLAQAIARGITKAGVAVESLNAEAADPTEIKTSVEKSAGFIIGSPTLGGHAPTQIQTALGSILSIASTTKLAGVFGSYGWSGEAIDLLEDKLRDAGYKFGFDPIRVKFKPTDVTLKYCEEAGTDFAQALKKVKRAKATRKPASAVEQAVGRLVGSLCVLTAQQGEVASAMLASWVAQATFTPPGITVAIAKDRAVESLMYPDSRFVLNILAEDKYLGPMKHFLKPFGPGENRFDGIETNQANNGAPILKESLAYLECQVKNRLESGDHWVIYAVVESGNVLRQEVKTAVHHRKSGSNY